MDRRTLLRLLALGAAAACAPVRTTGPSPSAPSTGRPTDADVAAPSRDVRAAPTPAEPSPAEPDPTVGSEPPSAVTLPVYCRAAWGARAPRDGMRAHTITRLTVHHSAVPLRNLTDGPAHLRQYQRFHMDTQGWPDIAYHVGVDRAGNVYGLRRPDRAGDTATDYDPASHFLLLLDGDFDAQTPSEAQMEAAARVLAWAATSFDVGLDTVSGHRDHTVTSCPGDELYARLDALEGRARDLQAAGGVDLVEICGDAGRDAVAAIESGRA